jgi:hypothetical protein
MNPWIVSQGGAIAVFVYAYGTTEVQKGGKLEFHFMPQRSITYVQFVALWLFNMHLWSAL